MNPGVYLIGQQLIDKSLIKIGKAEKDIESRLSQYFTAAPCIEILDTRPLPISYIARIERQYHQELSQLGILIPRTKEWFEVPKEIYQQIMQKGFKYFKMNKNNLSEIEIHLNKNEEYMTKTIYDILCKLMDPNCDFAAVAAKPDGRGALNSRINEAIHVKKERGKQLQLIADRVQRRSKTGQYRPTDGPNSNKNKTSNKHKYLAEEIADIIDDPTLNISGYEFKSKPKWILEDIVDGVVINTADIPMPKFEQPITSVCTTPTNILEQYRYNEALSIKQNKTNLLFLQEQMKIINQYITEYNEVIVFK